MTIGARIARLTLEDAKKIIFNQNNVFRKNILIVNHPYYGVVIKGIHDGKHWCPYCSKYARENLCREIISKYLGPPSKIPRTGSSQERIMWIVLRFVWYYEDPYIVIPEHLRELGLIERS
ncbi:hypothetical protein Glove_218g33 [Diversispora epigaea]|uniref:Uncharacterized protein n=1 Tax=Diversispora epigaea TaxID=1348612 RepID=A0A397IGQ8_9GLOM|nr:hypothetical protein Glove_218g33 [Diversispora epigaea]